jgi:hypothetical protein
MPVRNAGTLNSDLAAGHLDCVDCRLHRRDVPGWWAAQDICNFTHKLHISASSYSSGSERIVSVA